ncbi:molybdopterin molybdenumtransferase MoeA [Rhodovibrio sodomensis]|uniref:Molybdopterin molybdenumtransferase n=1 Tax=Rhodovibrio sodomensis TaxID=1088 RepID=A0ABS1DJT6_9PROT|nr:gephyrin-like molybdotransferase Glp [Rhodovibrio sodomensis]MBK1669753.1 molybdopterin molybdenumtransferase MoeA [Rhodovibrio sodomensis]
MAQLSDDCFAHGDRLMRVEEALAQIRQRITAVAEPETVGLHDALGRVLLEDVVSAIDVPQQGNSAVDGYAVFFDDLNPEAETTLPVAGRVAAGHALDRPARRGEAIRIFTGAPMPDGPDTVMMQEDCQETDGRVAIKPGIARGANQRAAGEDVAAGSTVLHAGQRLRPPDLGQAAAVGRNTLRVARPLEVGVVSTGDELCEPGGPLAPGGIYDSNRFTVHGLLRQLGCRVHDLGILPDDRAAVTDALADAAERLDLVVTSGGVSVGEEDHVKQAVAALGRLHTWRLAIKPGRPIALGQLGRVPFVGLPGNPVAVVVTFVTIVRPLILRMLGGRAARPHLFKVKAGFDHKKKRARREWVRARLVAHDGDLRVDKYPSQGAGVLSSIVESDGLVELPEDMTQLEAGTLVDFLPFSEVA